MKTSEINPTANYRNNDERLGDPGTYGGAEILAQLADFAEDGDFECDEDWNIEEV